MLIAIEVLSTDILNRKEIQNSLKYQKAILNMLLSAQ